MEKYELFASIRPESKYADQSEKDVLFSVTLETDETYFIIGNGNRYRLQDVRLYACAGGVMVKISM